MELQHHVLTRSVQPESTSAFSLLKRVFGKFPAPMAVKLWNNETATFGVGVPEFTLVFRSPSALRDVILFQSPLRLAHAFFSGSVDVEGSLYRALELRNFLGQPALPWFERLRLLRQMFSRSLEAPAATARQLTVAKPRPNWLGRLQDSRDHKRDIAFHYDVSNAFYRCWLDEQMVYSCAYFEQDTDSLDQAQMNKLEHICRKLRLKPGERMLDIGCGWGALAIWAARHHGVSVKAITLSRNQFDFASQRVREEGLADRVTVELRDYRDLGVSERFDKVSSVGMFEHVGLTNLPAYFATVNRVLKPGGLFLNHGITHDEEGWRQQLTTKFINRYVFPGGELDTVSNVLRRMEYADFEVWDVEGLRPHYAKTLRHWVARLEAAKAEALQHVSEATYRVWRLYMAGCALHFELGDVGIYQILASKRAANLAPLPLTRRDLYV